MMAALIVNPATPVTPPASPTLLVWVAGQHAATLTLEAGEFMLAYEGDWQANGYAFSPHLPLKSITRGATVEHFFSNLLPEGDALMGLAQASIVRPHDVFGLLRKVGRDCAGALVITEPGEPPESAALERAYQPISDAELNQRITEAAQENVPLMFWRAKRRMSLAGVQNKLGVFMDTAGGLQLPLDAAPTSHIMKLGNERHPSMVANEYFCMQLAAALQLPVARTHFRRLPEPVLLVERYDRLWMADGNLQRIHQIDGCQALNLPPSRKYEEAEYGLTGASLVAILALAQTCHSPIAAQMQLLNWVLFNYLIGNSDAHAKNISFLINPPRDSHAEPQAQQGMWVAPLYDLVCGADYRYFDMAQLIGGESNFRLIQRENWAEFAADCGLGKGVLKALATPLLKRLDARLNLTAERVSNETNDPAIARLKTLVAEHAELLQTSLA